MLVRSRRFGLVASTGGVGLRWQVAVRLALLDRSSDSCTHILLLWRLQARLLWLGVACEKLTEFGFG